MVSDRDFLEIYAQLGVTAECSVQEFKHAYRRRVAQLHPDRQHAPDTTRELQKLNAGYAAALAFEREHRRLPGARPRRRPDTPTPPPRTPPINTESPQQPLHMRGFLLLALVLAGFGWMLLAQLEAPLPTSQPTHFSGAAQPSPPPRAVRSVIHVGASATNVRTSLGAPVSIHGRRWEYGPSWVEFQDDSVVDWYSSPLRPLTVIATPGKPSPPAR